MNFFKDKSKLFCFTPEVMLATFVIEFTLALIVFVRYKLNPKTRVCIFALVALGIFQLAEYRICMESYEMFWAYFGFAAITLLPAFGLDLVTLADNDRKKWVPFGYILSFIVIFSIFYFSSIENAVCGGNYVIFKMNLVSDIAFTVYYLGLLFLGIFIAIRDLLRARKNGNFLKIKLYFWILVGYFSFLVPTGVIYILSTDAQQASASIMCGFAVGLSFILFFKVIPALLIILSNHKYHKHLQKHKS